MVYSEFYGMYRVCVCCFAHRWYVVLGASQQLFIRLFSKIYTTV